MFVSSHSIYKMVRYRGVIKLNHRHVLFQTLSENINKWPLGVPLKQTCPQPENRHSQCGRLEVWRSFRLIIQVNRGVRLFNNALRPAEDAALIFCKISD